jgi:hypothetical protein
MSWRNIEPTGVCVPIEAQRLGPSAQRNVGQDCVPLFGSCIEADGSDRRRSKPPYVGVALGEAARIRFDRQSATTTAHKTPRSVNAERRTGNDRAVARGRLEDGGHVPDPPSLSGTVRTLGATHGINRNCAYDIRPNPASYQPVENQHDRTARPLKEREKCVERTRSASGGSADE